ncbi:MAG: glycosyl transferase, partial [archaeon]|nr:glycosyl transferase [archaeon]
ATVFPGDVGTLPIGAFLAASAALGAPLLPLMILSIPYFFDMLLKFITMGIASSKRIVPTRVENGILVPQKSYLSLTNLILRIKGMREWQLVAIYWLVEIALGIVTLVI